jgi:hypothetical protein
MVTMEEARHSRRNRRPAVEAYTRHPAGEYSRPEEEAHCHLEGVVHSRPAVEAYTRHPAAEECIHPEGVVHTHRPEGVERRILLEELCSRP